MRDKKAVEEALADICKSVEEAAAKHGMYTVPFYYSLEGDVVRINLSVFDRPPEVIFKEAFLAQCESLGLPEDLAGGAIEDPSTGMTWTVLGVDPDGGACSIRLVSVAGVHAHTRPEAVKRWLEASAQ